MSITTDRTDGLSSSTAVKGPCRLATTIQLAAFSGLPIIDSVQTVENDRILVKDEVSGINNGIWIATTGDWRRSADFGQTGDVVQGTKVQVVEGTINGATEFYVSNTGTIVVGTTAIVWERWDAVAVSIATVSNLTALKALSTATYGHAVQDDNGFRWNWTAGDYATEIAADTDQNTYAKADAIAAASGAWVRVSPYVPPTIGALSIRFDQYRARYGTDQDAFEAMIIDAFDPTTTSAYGINIDLCGTTLLLTDPIDVATLTGRTTNYKTLTFMNGTLRADTGSAAWAHTTASRQCTTTQLSNIVTTTDTTGLEVGMCMQGTGETYIPLGDGLPRETYITGITNGTTFTVNTTAYRTRTKYYNIMKYPYFLTFKGFTVCSRVRFINMNFRCEGVASVVQMSVGGIDWVFHNLHCYQVDNRLITDWNAAASGAQFSMITAWANDITEDRTCVGLTITDNDAKFIANRIINFRHSQVMHGSGYIITNCHNWQGSSTTISRQPAFVHTNPRAYCSYTNNYIDNGGIAFTTENAGVVTLAFNDITITGNIFTMSDDAATTDRYIMIDIMGYTDGTTDDTPVRGIDGMSVNNNVFRRLLGSPPVSAIPTVEAVTTYGGGGLNPAAIRDFTWTGNTYRGITYHKSNPNKYSITKEAADVTATWTFDFVNRLPFGLVPKQVTSSHGGLVGTHLASTALTYPSYTSYLKTYASAGDEFIVFWRTATAIYGTVTMTADANYV